MERETDERHQAIQTRVNAYAISDLALQNGSVAGLVGGKQRFKTPPDRRARVPLDTSRAIHNYTVVDSLSLTLSALSDPTRRAILARLKAGPASVTELSEPFGVSQQAISKHLAYLERANLVQTRRDGRQQIRELNPTPIREVAEWAEEYRRYWEGAFSRLRDFLHRQTASRQRGERKP